MKRIDCVCLAIKRGLRCIVCYSIGFNKEWSTKLQTTNTGRCCFFHKSKIIQFFSPHWLSLDLLLMKQIVCPPLSVTEPVIEGLIVVMPSLNLAMNYWTQSFVNFKSFYHFNIWHLQLCTLQVFSSISNWKFRSSLKCILEFEHFWISETLLKHKQHAMNTKVYYDNVFSVKQKENS